MRDIPIMRSRFYRRIHLSIGTFILSNLSWHKEGNTIQYCLVRSEGHIDEVLSEVQPSATCYSTRPPRILE